MSRIRIRRAAGLFALVVLSVALLGRSAPAQSFQHVYAGNAFKAAIKPDGSAVWTCEDGGRVRHRGPGGWSFQTISDSVKDQFLSISFLDDGLIGWAVGLNGWYIKTSNGGQQWVHPYQFPNQAAPEELWDVVFTDAQTGWLVALHNLYITTATTGGGINAGSWNPVILLDKVGNLLTSSQLSQIDFYGIDVVTASSVPNPPPGANVVGLLVAKPGLIFRSVDADGLVWKITYDMCQDLCVSNPSEVPACLGSFCSTCASPSGLGFSLYDVAISRNPNTPLALAVGGNVSSCGMIFSSSDHGLNWQRRYDRMLWTVS